MLLPIKHSLPRAHSTSLLDRVEKFLSSACGVELTGRMWEKAGSSVSMGHGQRVGGNLVPQTKGSK